MEVIEFNISQVKHKSYIYIVYFKLQKGLRNNIFVETTEREKKGIKTTSLSSDIQKLFQVLPEGYFQMFCPNM